MLPLQPENFRLDGCPGKLYGLVTGVLSLLVELGGLIAVAGRSENWRNLRQKRNDR